MIDEARMIDALLPKVAGDPRGMLHLAQRMKAHGQMSRAAGLCADLLALPDVPAFVAVRAQTIVAGNIPGFHYNMVFDRIRNQAYEAALARALRPGMRVLEIGTGAGLLAMMAVRAGAGHVHTCEVDPQLARVAREIVAANGLSDRITVHARHSSTLDVMRDLGGRADLLVSEIIGDRLIDEGVLPSHAHAVGALLVPGAPVIPLRGSIRVAPVEMTDETPRSLGDVEGFDLTAFTALRPRSRMVQAGSPDLALRGDPVDLFSFAFDGGAPPSATVTRACRSHGGRVSGVVQWIAFDLDDTTSYDNRPHPDASSHWWVNYHSLPAPRDTAPGDTIDVQGWYDRANVAVWLE